MIEHLLQLAVLGVLKELVPVVLKVEAVDEPADEDDEADPLELVAQNPKAVAPLLKPVTGYLLPQGSEELFPQDTRGLP